MFQLSAFIRFRCQASIDLEIWDCRTALGVGCRYTVLEFRVWGLGSLFQVALRR